MRKFVLVSPEELERLRSSKKRQDDHTEYKIIDPRLNTMMRVDNDISSTLKNPHISEEEKAEAYSRDLEEFLTYKNQNSVKSVNIKPPTVNAISTLEIGKTAPKNLRGKAERLADLIKESGTMAWDEQGRLIVDGAPMEGTNIIDLINDALRKRKTFFPSGRNYFANRLRTMNAPRELVGNPSYWGDALLEEGPKLATPQRTPKSARKKRKGLSESMEDIDWSTDIDL